MSQLPVITTKFLRVNSFIFQIAETYAFLPREAVTRFLMNCNECQKRMHLSPSLAAEVNGYQITSNSQNQDNNNDSSGTKDFNQTDNLSSPDSQSSTQFKMIDYSLPITTTYLSQLRNMRLASNNNSVEVSQYLTLFYHWSTKPSFTM